MYGSVPPIIARSPCSAEVASAARLKSRSIGVPSAAIRMFEGFRSRWSSPREWACSSPSASLAAIQTVALTKLASRRNRRAGWTGSRSSTAAGSGLVLARGGAEIDLDHQGIRPRSDLSGTEWPDLGMEAWPVPASGSGPGVDGQPWRRRIEAGDRASLGAGWPIRSSASTRLRPAASAGDGAPTSPRTSAWLAPPK